MRLIDADALNRPSRTAIEKKAIEVYGEGPQVLKCMEECAELIEVLCECFETDSPDTRRVLHVQKERASLIKDACKILNSLYNDFDLRLSPNSDRGKVRNEIADVKITAGDQMPMIFGTTLIEEDAKLTRLAGRLGMMEDDNGETR